MMLALNSDRKKTPTLRGYRNLTREEILALRRGQQVMFILPNGRVGWLRVNGAVRTWKRDPDRVEIPMKYGIKECLTLNLERALEVLVAEI